MGLDKVKIIILLLLIIPFLGIYALKPILLNNFYYLLSFLIVLIILIIINEDKVIKHFNQTHEMLSDNAIKLTRIFVITMFSTLVILGIFYTPEFIIIQPEKFEKNVTIGNEIDFTIKIDNRGADLTNVNYQIIGINNNWFHINSKELKNLKKGQSALILINFTIPQNATIGEYYGVIIIEANSNGKNISKSIPILFRVMQ